MGGFSGEDVEYAEVYSISRMASRDKNGLYLTSANQHTAANPITRKMMSRLIPALERIVRARALIQKARDLPIPSETGHRHFSYITR